MMELTLVFVLYDGSEFKLTLVFSDWVRFASIFPILVHIFPRVFLFFQFTVLFVLDTATLTASRQSHASLMSHRATTSGVLLHMP